MISAAMIEEMRQGAAKRFRAKVATMTRAEVVAAHDAVCARVEAAIRGGHDLPPFGWDLDEVSILQARRDELREPEPVEPLRAPPVMVSCETAYGRTVRLRDAVLCF